MIQRGTLKPLTLAIRDQINNQLGFIQSPTALYITAGSLNNGSILNREVRKK